MSRKKVSDPSTRTTAEQRLHANRRNRVRELADVPAGKRVETVRAQAQREFDRDRTGRAADARAKRTIVRRTKDSTRIAPNKIK